MRPSPKPRPDPDSISIAASSSSESKTDGYISSSSSEGSANISNKPSKLKGTAPTMPTEKSKPKTTKESAPTEKSKPKTTKDFQCSWWTHFYRTVDEHTCRGHLCYQRFQSFAWRLCLLQLGSCMASLGHTIKRYHFPNFLIDLFHLLIKIAYHQFNKFPSNAPFSISRHNRSHVIVQQLFSVLSNTPQFQAYVSEMSPKERYGMKNMKPAGKANLKRGTLSRKKNVVCFRHANMNCWVKTELISYRDNLLSASSSSNNFTGEDLACGFSMQLINKHVEDICVIRDFNHLLGGYAFFIMHSNLGTY